MVCTRHYSPINSIVIFIIEFPISFINFSILLCALLTNNLDGSLFFVQQNVFHF